MPKLIIEISNELQQKIKQKALDQGKTIKELITTVIERLVKDGRDKNK